MRGCCWPEAGWAPAGNADAENARAKRQAASRLHVLTVLSSRTALTCVRQRLTHNDEAYACSSYPVSQIAHRSTVCSGSCALLGVSEQELDHSSANLVNKAPNT